MQVLKKMALMILISLVERNGLLLKLKETEAIHKTLKRQSEMSSIDMEIFSGTKLVTHIVFWRYWSTFKEIMRSEVGNMDSTIF